MPLRIYIDDPADLQIRRPVSQIRGWCAADSSENLVDLRFQIAGRRLPHRALHRPDVEESLSEKGARGFLLDLDLGHHLPGIRKGEFVLELISAGAPVATLRFRVAGEALGKCLETASGA